MNIVFDNKTYEELFCELYKDIANKYNLKIRKNSKTEMSLTSNIFTLLLSYDMDTVWIYYIFNQTKETYLISNYVNVNAEDVDRNDIPKDEIISKQIKRILVIQSRVLDRKFGNLLIGKMDWFEDYKKSKFYCLSNFPNALLGN